MPRSTRGTLYESDMPRVRPSRELNWHQTGKGVRFVFREKVMLAALSLDLPAVFFGGEIVTTRMLKNLAEIDGGAVLSRALNDEEARAIAAKSVALVSSSSTRIVRVRTDLSYSAGK